MKSVLIISTNGFGYEGITSVVRNYISNMNTEKLDVHFVADSQISDDLHQVFLGLGTIHFIEKRKSSLKKYLVGLFQLLRKVRFDVVHIHGNSGTMLIEVVLAKICRVKNIIIHAHSTSTNHPIINGLLKVPMMHLADTCLACSKAAGDWLYGKHPYIILNNAIDLNRFRFDENSRIKYREEFGVKEEFLIGHIGHFTPPKNHFFLIDIFHEFHKLEPNSKLLLLSDGPRFQQVKAKVADLGLQDAVIFAGSRSDVAGIYSAMDFFILPSLWEGLGMVLIEAQASGLPVLASDVVPKEAICTECMVCKPLADGAAEWARQVQIMKKYRHDRNFDTYTRIVENGFDIHMEVEKLRQIYLN